MTVYASGNIVKNVKSVIVPHTGGLCGIAAAAAKIAGAVEAGLLGMQMYRHGSQFYSGDGIVTKWVENTIRNVGLLARDGMRETDREIIKIMLKKV